MAQGDVDVFDKAMENVWDSGIFDFGATPNSIFVAIINNTAAPLITDTDPRWSAGGTPDHSANEETGTNFPAGGRACATATATLSAGTLEIDFGDPAVWAKNAGNPTACFWGIVYDNTTPNKEAYAFVDLGGVFDATTGDLTIAWGAPFHTVNQT